jgi:hypothetical protein
MANTNTCIPKEIATKLKQQFKAKKPLTPNELKQKISDLVKTKYGVDLSPVDAEQIVKLNGTLRTAKEKLGDNIGSIEHEKEMIDYFVAENKMNEYLKTLDPSSSLDVATGTIGRGVMLTSVKSPLINIGSNLENSAIEALTRRFSTGQFKTLNTDLAKKYVGMSTRVYQKTGVDLSRMLDIGDTGIGGQRVLGKDTISSIGKGTVKKIGRFFEDKIFKQLMGAPDNVTASVNFADSAMLGSTKAAKGNTKIAEGYLKDAFLLNPKTPVGKTIRAQAVLDSQISTYTQRTTISAISEGIRNVLNKLPGRPGDWIMPFVKTPANIIATGLDYAGGGIFKGLYQTMKGISEGTLKDPATIKKIAQGFTRGGIGIVAALSISQLFNEDDFVGAYDPKRNQIEQLKNSNFNAVRIGDRWVSTEWFGPLAIPLTAIMYAKKGDGYINKMQGYAKGFTSALGEIPGAKVFSDTLKNIEYASDSSPTDVASSAGKASMESIASRLIPGIVTDVSKAIDPFQRDTKGGIFDTIINKTPAKMTLPIKENILGEQLKRESVLETILFGSRVKKQNVSSIVKEVDKVTSALDKGSTFTDWMTTSSKEITQFKEKIGEEKFKEAKTLYGQELNKQLTSLFNNPRYQKMSDEDKLAQINKQDTQAKELIFRKFRFVYRQQKSKKQPNL